MEISVEEVKPRDRKVRVERGVQSLKIVAIESKNRYAAVFFRTRSDDKEVMRTGEKFHNGNAFYEGRLVWIPQNIFSQMTKRAGAVMFEKKPKNEPSASIAGKQCSLPF